MPHSTQVLRHYPKFNINKINNISTLVVDLLELFTEDTGGKRKDRFNTKNDYLVTAIFSANVGDVIEFQFFKNGTFDSTTGDIGINSDGTFSVSLPFGPNSANPPLDPGSWQVVFLGNGAQLGVHSFTVTLPPNWIAFAVGGLGGVLLVRPITDFTKDLFK